MKKRRYSREISLWSVSPFVVMGAMVSLLGLSMVAADKRAIDFSTEILPLLSDRCFYCHGPDEGHRQAGLRLDLEREAVGTQPKANTPIIAGSPESSYLLERLRTEDLDERMPPPESKKSLSESEIQLIEDWIQQGAPWGKHWAFEPPVKAPIDDQANHPIDFLVNRRLKNEKVTANPRAPNHTRLRRLTFGLTGLPPSSAQLNSLPSPPTNFDWEKMVDRLLSSEHFGERMAMWWMDAARYSDTDGYQQDATRTNWPWRDWVIDAFNSNMPFDQFTREQFAGDLIPDAQPEQILATTFHRNHMTNGEGGRHPEESRIDYVIDRVNTTGSVFLGLTLGCAQCHSHKFDPISQEEFYQLNAFFNTLDEDGRAGSAAKPYLPYQSPYAERAVLEATRFHKKQQQALSRSEEQSQVPFQDWVTSLEQTLTPKYHPWHAIQTTNAKSVEGTILKIEHQGIIQASGPNPRQDDYFITGTTDLQRLTGFQIQVFPHPSHTDGKLSRGTSGEFILTNVKLYLKNPSSSEVKDIELSRAIADAQDNPSKSGRRYGRVNDTLDDDPRNGWTTKTNDPKQSYRATFTLKEPLLLEETDQLQFVLMQRSTIGNANIGRFQVFATDQRGELLSGFEPSPIEALATLNKPPFEAIPDALKQRLYHQFLLDHQPYQKALTRFNRSKKHLAEMQKALKPLPVMVMKEQEKPRDTHVLIRGVWDKKGDLVKPGVPRNIFPLETDDNRTPDRMDLANWLMSENNPLTARVIVNQIWQLFFGTGLVRTPEDFGLQGQLPTHPQLLDWLAVEFVESGWNVKRLIKLIVTSDAFHRASEMTPNALEYDPGNRLLARGPRFRLPSWMLHDAVLHSSGLLNPAIGGPPVMPHQPPGVWEEIFKGRFTYDPSPGSARYRRTLYTFWRRSSAPTFLFDSSARLVCEVGIRRTNTPLHALTRLNDVTLLEASQRLASQALATHSLQVDHLNYLSRATLSRSLSDQEIDIYQRELETFHAHYQNHQKDAMELLTVGQTVANGDEALADLAALTLVANMMYNLDEAVTHE